MGPDWIGARLGRSVLGQDSAPLLWPGKGGLCEVRIIGKDSSLHIQTRLKRLGNRSEIVTGSQRKDLKSEKDKCRR